MHLINQLLLLSMLLLSHFLVNCNDMTKSAISVVNQKEDNNEESVVSIDEEDNSDEDSSEPFIATNEWQTIKKGQVIAAGLHVRINLETGLKEAKILDKSKDQMDVNSRLIDKHKKAIEIETEMTSKSNQIRDQIKEVLKNLKFGQQLNANEEKMTEKTSTNFRSIDEIKKDLDDMNLNIQSETELMINLMEKYKKSSTDEKLIILYDIEYLVHSIDVAQDLVKLNGIQLLLPDLNSTNSQLREQIAFTIGSAMNSNPKVQSHVLKSGALHKLLLLLRYDSSHNVKKRALFAISCLVRHFPSAQKALIKEYGALSIFANLFKDTNINSVKLNLKVITLLNDLLIEHKMIVKYATNDKLIQTKLQQYNDIGLSEAIVDEGFCELVPHLLNSPDNDVREKTIEAMNSFSSLCRQQFGNSLPILEKISIQLNELSKSEIGSDASDSYFTNLYQLTNNLINKLNLKDEL